MYLNLFFIAFNIRCGFEVRGSVNGV